jgi:hypothetical protein
VTPAAALRRRLALPVTAVIALVVCPHALRAQPTHLAPGEVTPGAIEPEPPAIELLTFGIGARIFEKFGHAAICLVYHQPVHPAVCFNYGVTDFDAGAAMVWRFLRGEQKFWAEATTQREMLRFYRAEDRDIWRQRLPISGDDARAVESWLWNSIREENRYYLYDHFFDNCATRVRDLIDRATHGALRAGGDARYPQTFREIGRRGLAGLPALLVLSDLVLGPQIDQHPTQWQAMFHPEVLRLTVAARLHASPELVYGRRGLPFPTRGQTGRLSFLAIAVVFALPLFLARWRRRFELPALIAATIALTALGIVVWGVAIAAAIPALRWNEAALVVLPIDAILAFLSWRHRKRYAQIRLLGLALVSVLRPIGVLHQPLWIVILAVALPMAALAYDLPHEPEP